MPRKGILVKSGGKFGTHVDVEWRGPEIEKIVQDDMGDEIFATTEEAAEIAVALAPSTNTDNYPATIKAERRTETLSQVVAAVRGAYYEWGTSKGGQPHIYPGFDIARANLKKRIEGFYK